MKFKLLFWCLALPSIFGLSAFVLAEDPFATLLKKLEEYSKKYPQESVHLHLDKPYYAIGDNIWFKGYVFDVQRSSPTSLSKILYVELFDAKDSLRRQLKLPMENGITWGSIALPDTLTEGNYRLRAYTQLMRNAGPDFFFDKTLKIGNSWANKVFVNTTYQYTQIGSNESVNTKLIFTDKDGKPIQNSEVTYNVELSARNIAKGRLTTNVKGEVDFNFLNTQPGIYKAGKITATLTLPDKNKITKIIPVKSTSSTIDVQFFPEGGTLLTGLPIKVAFKATNSQGKGEDLKGSIVDNEGNEITTFETGHLGMGSFFINALANKTYAAKVKFSNGSEKTIALPKVENSGYALSINNMDTAKVIAKILTTEDLVGKTNLILLAHQNGSVYFTAKIPAGKNLAVANLPKQNLPSGITTLSLFNTENQLVSERLIFVSHAKDKIDIKPLNLQQIYGKRGLVDLNLQSKVGEKIARASFSVAVTNASSVEPDLENETNILTSLLLKSELKGYIQNPNYYFLKDDQKTKSDLDHLLLTQGWRKVNWKNLQSGQLVAPIFSPENDLRISGVVTSNGGKPIANGKVSLFSSSKGIFAIDTLTDANGRFNFDALTFQDSTKFIVQARNEKGKKDVVIKLDIIPGQQITPNPNAAEIEVNVNEQLKKYLDVSEDYFTELSKRGMLNRTIQLKKVEIVGQKKQLENSSNLNGAGRADAVITAKDLENATLLSNYLMGRVAGITIRNGQAYARQSSSPMQIVLDGMNMQDMTLDDINIFDIESIEVLKSIGNTAIYGSRGASGVLVINTKRGGSSTSVPYAPGIITYNPKGYSTSREFYVPRYDKTNDLKPDLRTTIYWNPAIISDENGNFNLNFYNADMPGIYRIVIEGVDLLGNIGRASFNYEVK